MADPYSILGVKKDASADEVKRAYRKLAKTWHPDHNKDNPKAKERFAEINSAYEILGDDGKRKAFDRGEIDADGKPRAFHEGFGGGGPRPGAGGFHFEFGGNPFGANPFGGGAGPYPGGGPNFSGKHGDPRDIFSDLFKQFNPGGPDPAQQARGHGRKSGSIPTGEDADITADVSLETVAAGGAVRITLPDGRNVEVNVPQGVANGTTMRLKGQGHPSPFGGAKGDVRLTLRYARHARFTPDGADVRVSVPVPIRDAVLGGAVRVPTLSGEVEVTVPAWTSGGKTLRLKGKGLPLKERTGDLFVSLDLDLGPPDAEVEGFFRRRPNGPQK